MSKLKEKISTDLKTALKAKEEVKLSTLRLLLADLENKEIERKRKELTDEDVMEVISSAIKKRKESIEQYKQGGREELAKKEEEEIKILQDYLPEQLSDDKLSKVIDEAIKKTGAKTPQDMGKVMGQVMSQVKGKAEGQKVSELVKKKLMAK